MAAIEAQGITADGLLGETAMPAPNTYVFVPFDNGPIWVWERGPSEHGLHTDWGSKVAADLWNLYQAAEAKLAAVPVTPPAPTPEPTPEPPTPPVVDWQAKYESLKAAVTTAVANN